MTSNATIGDTSISSPNTGLLHYVALSSVSMATTTLLCVIKYSLYSYLKRTYYDHEAVACLERNITRYRHVRKERLSWYHSDLCCELIIFLTMASMGFYSLHFTTLLLKPFTGKEAFHSCEIFLCVALGCLSYRLIRLLLGSDMKPRFKLLQAYVVVAMVTYISIIVTSENTIIGVIGMFCQLSTLFHTLEKIYLELYTDIRYNGCFTSRFASSLHATSVVLFSLVLPLIYLCLAVKTESPFVMTYYSLAVLMFSVPYFIITKMLDVVHHLVISTCMDDSLLRVTERSQLVEPFSKKNTNFYASKTLIQSDISVEKMTRSL
ncbi:hypothetical protein LSH36_3g21019 [Paralvinella palmiformis]|uniref:Uncharacterized protein n=1 Tax=Paralvinella palmiformis TaxID=53620 RepID=A0AAD9NHL8_9ANNE|nr:hypothetical protein LSH36_3g21019 [Paralvinella palmiformis]